MALLPEPGGNSLIRRFLGPMGAVARIGAVPRTALPPSIDPARGTDPRWIEISRPDAAAIPIGDITFFRELVYESNLRQAQGASPAGGTTPAALAEERFTPADRIVGTLKHLRGMYGL